jgi:hypothetical protein
MEPEAAYRAVARAHGDGHNLTTVERLRKAYPSKAEQLQAVAKARVEQYRKALGSKPENLRVLMWSSQHQLVLDLRWLIRQVHTRRLNQSTIDKLDAIITQAIGILG